MIFGWGPVPALGLPGAAYATVASRSLAFVALLAVLHFRLHLVTFDWPSPSAVLASWKALLYVAVPAAVTNVITPVSIAIITALVAPFGAAVVAGFGVAGRMQLFALVPILALTASQGPLVGQNWGAGKLERVAKTVQLSCAFSMVWGLVMAILLAFIAPMIARVFNANATVVATATAYLRIVPISYGAYGVIICTNAAFNAMGKPIFASALNLSRTLVFYVPLAYAGAAWFGLYGIFGAAPVASFIVGAAAWFWNRRVYSKQRCGAATGRAV
jgi:Na+-driven multidrug efflux pump